ncbi:hypothetical protein ABZ714_34795 [Streptomyces sp. NPDC006798]|uniref:hypothetical protein n=1 Tax=Streptomyces sp. NPDC006798 TaxID=3155462 RepID=UPI00340C23AB
MADVAAGVMRNIARRGGREYAVPPEEPAAFPLSGLDGLCPGAVVRGTGPGPGTRRALDRLVSATAALAFGPGAERREG